MTVVAREAFPNQIELLDHVWIPMDDGCRLAGRIWLPVNAHNAPVPALLEFLPYRKDDGTAVRDSKNHPYFAGHGYASVRVDIRGTGNSDGVFDDEYSPQEQRDALALLRWLAAQQWCDGKVGMFGVSWGGFNSLQIAALRPPQLKAIVTVCSTDDRYSDDVHYKGGCVIADQMLPWAATMLSYAAAPPDPRIVGDGWRDTWLARLEGLTPLAQTWLAHQTRDGYWQHGSVCEDFDAIDCATLVVGGWEDGYTNAAVRLVRDLSCPRRGIIGPWAHAYPHLGVPGPRIGFLQECVRWWDYWLKDQRHNGAMEEPLLRLWLQHWTKPAPWRPMRAGHWTGLEDLCSQQTHQLWLGQTALVPTPDPGGQRIVVTAEDVGAETGDWCPYGRQGELAPDQRREDSQWIRFDSQPLTEPLEIFGFPSVYIRLRSDRSQANLCLRLCDVAPDGASLLVSQGLLNLTHRDGSERPAALEPGAAVDVAVTLDALAHVFVPDHRIRLAVSPTSWPRVWPPSRPAVLTIETGAASVLSLPMLSEVRSEPVLPPAEVAQPLAAEQVTPERSHRSIVRKYTDSVQTEMLVVEDPGWCRLEASDTGFQLSGVNKYLISSNDPLSARVHCERQLMISRGEWQVRTDANTWMTADSDFFRVGTEVEAYEGARLVHRANYELSIPRTEA